MIDEYYLTGPEVARMFGVSVKTVSRWADQGIVPFVRTPGGQRRYPQSAVLALRGEKGPKD
jgi:excisionase family DNA binding protein